MYRLEVSVLKEHAEAAVHIQSCCMGSCRPCQAWATTLPSRSLPGAAMHHAIDQQHASDADLPSHRQSLAGVVGGQGASGTLQQHLAGHVVADQRGGSSRLGQQAAHVDAQ